MVILFVSTVVTQSERVKKKCKINVSENILYANASSDISFITTYDRPVCA